MRRRRTRRRTKRRKRRRALSRPCQKCQPVRQRQSVTRRSHLSRSQRSQPSARPLITSAMFSTRDTQQITSRLTETDLGVTTKCGQTEDPTKCGPTEDLNPAGLDNASGAHAVPPVAVVLSSLSGIPEDSGELLSTLTLTLSVTLPLQPSTLARLGGTRRPTSTKVLKKETMLTSTTPEYSPRIRRTTPTTSREVMHSTPREPKMLTCSRLLIVEVAETDRERQIRQYLTPLRRPTTGKDLLGATGLMHTPDKLDLGAKLDGMVKQQGGTDREVDGMDLGITDLPSITHTTDAFTFLFKQ